LTSALDGGEWSAGHIFQKTGRSGLRNHYIVCVSLKQFPSYKYATIYASRIQLRGLKFLILAASVFLMSHIHDSQPYATIDLTSISCDSSILFLSSYVRSLKFFMLAFSIFMEGWRRLHNEELHNMYASPNIITVINSWRMRRVGHVECMGGMRNAYKICWKI